MFLSNPAAVRSTYDFELQQVLSLAAGRQARECLKVWSMLSPRPTPAWPLPHLARSLGIAAITLKDESERSSLGSFKALGAPFALIQLVLRRWPEKSWTPARLFAGAYADVLKHFVVISATDGNHGRALAAAAQSVGCRCVIVLHAQVSLEREQAIAAFGAQIVRIAGNYDESVEQAARLARENGWDVVSDTSYVGYEEVPRDVMQGYGLIAEELLQETPGEAAPDCAVSMDPHHPSGRRWGVGGGNHQPLLGAFRRAASPLHHGGTGAGGLSAAERHPSPGILVGR